MQIDIQCSPSYAIAYCFLEAGEKLRAESGSMALMSTGLDVSVDAGPGGIAKGLMRKGLAKESFFMTTYTARVHGAWVAVAPKYPGDLHVVDVAEATGGMFVESGSLLALSGGLADDVRFAGLGNIAMHEGATMQRVHGDGKLLLATYGGMQRFELADGESLIIDTGHIVAMSDQLRRSMRVGPLAGLVKAKLSGEGLVAELTGPGVLLAQTRAEAGLRSWLFPERGARNNG